MTTVSCIVVTTLIVVSLANLVLLVHVIMYSMSKCDTPSKKLYKTHKNTDFITQEQAIASGKKHKFLGALVVSFGDNKFEFVCGVAVISRKWVLSAAHCVEAVLDEPKDNVKISSDSVSLKQGVWYDTENLIFDKNLKSSLALISVRQQFTGKDISVVSLPVRSYKYLANTTATAVGWSGVEVTAVDVKLLSHRSCQSSYFGRVNDAKFCTEKKNCIFDYGGFLLQKNLLVGVMSFGLGCGPKPVIYTKVSVFEVWIRERKIEASFKGNV